MTKGPQPAVNLEEMEARARAILPAAIYDYFAGGAESEATVAGNLAAFTRHQLVPRALAGAGAPELEVEVIGTRVSMPVLLAPTGMQQLAHPAGELAVARAAASADTIYCVSTMATCAMEEVAAASTATKWFQLYVCRDRGLTTELVDRAAAAGYTALVVTADTPVIGRRERDQRNGFAMPPGMVYANLRRSVESPSSASSGSSGLASDAAVLFDPDVGWRDLEWALSRTSLPVLVKGLVSVADADIAAKVGVAGIIVSNHGGRQLDHAVATLDALPPIVDRVGDRVSVLVDGGVRRGTDVLKAIALGAKAVMIGRPYLWGLAVDGEAGVVCVLEQLRKELTTSMTLAGVHSVAEITPELVWNG
ncbi:MAG: alpha-hydroxy acid oxidase [Candidatus Dormibacteria bacterium]